MKYETLKEVYNELKTKRYKRILVTFDDNGKLDCNEYEVQSWKLNEEYLTLNDSILFSLDEVVFIDILIE